MELHCCLSHVRVDRHLGALRCLLGRHAHLHEPGVPVVRVPRPPLRHLPDEGQVGPVRGRTRIAVGEHEVVRGIRPADAEVAPRRLHLPHREVEVRVAQACKSTACLGLLKMGQGGSAGTAHSTAVHALMIRQES